jgi:hypothetical protein
MRLPFPVSLLYTRCCMQNAQKNPAQSYGHLKKHNILEQQ